MTTMSVNKKITDKIEIKNIWQQLFASYSDGCLQLVDNSVSYQIYLHRGRLIYATHSVEPFERLERHLRRFSREDTNLTSAIRTQARLNFDNEMASKPTEVPHEYQAICWLVEEGFISKNTAIKLIRCLTKEVLQSCLLLNNFDYKLITNSKELQIFDIINGQVAIEESLEQIKKWSDLAPEITSPYQRPFSQGLIENVTQEIQQKLSRILIGFSFRQIAVLLDQEELKLAQTLYPLIVKGIIKVKAPQHPFDKLPQIVNNDLIREKPTTVKVLEEKVIQDFRGIEVINNNPIKRKKFKLACVDDSPTILSEINRFLQEQELQIFTINDSVKALIEIMRIKPDLILLDVGMPTVDGYKLCRMIRNSSMFKTTPIIMVTGNNTVVDRAKAKVAGATDYMTKPFTQDELIKIVFRYLT